MGERWNPFVGLAWVLAGVAAILLYASVRGDGVGLFGSGALRHPLWTYGMFFAVVGVGLWLATGAGSPDGARLDVSPREREAR